MTMPKIHEFDLSFDGKRAVTRNQMVVRQGESMGEGVLTSLPASIAAAATAARFDIQHEDGTWARVTASVDSAAKTVKCVLPSGALNAPGMCRMAHFWVQYGESDDVLTSEDVMLRILPAVDVSDPTHETGCYDDRLNRLHDDMSEFDAAARQAEASRASAEALRVDAEDNREESEELRGSAEDARCQAESARQSAEMARAGAEQSRAGAESGRASAEQSRDAAEQSRVAAEAARVDAESGRASAESLRETKFAEMELRSKGWLRHYCIAGEYDATTGKPTVADPDGATIYFVPDPDASDGNGWVEWILDDSGDTASWERLGTSETTIDYITVDEIDGVANDEAKTGGGLLNLTGLSALWAKIKAKFAPKNHAAQGNTQTYPYGVANETQYGHVKFVDVPPSSQPYPPYAISARGAAIIAGQEMADFHLAPHYVESFADRFVAQNIPMSEFLTANRITSAAYLSVLWVRFGPIVYCFFNSIRSGGAQSSFTTGDSSSASNFSIEIPEAFRPLLTDYYDDGDAMAFAYFSAPVQTFPCMSFGSSNPNSHVQAKETTLYFEGIVGGTAGISGWIAYPGKPVT